MRLSWPGPSPPGGCRKSPSLAGRADKRTPSPSRGRELPCSVVEGFYDTLTRGEGTLQQGRALKGLLAWRTWAGCAMRTLRPGRESFFARPSCSGRSPDYGLRPSSGRARILHQTTPVIEEKSGYRGFSEGSRHSFHGDVYVCHALRLVWPPSGARAPSTVVPATVSVASAPDDAHPRRQLHGIWRNIRARR